MDRTAAVRGRTETVRVVRSHRTVDGTLGGRPYHGSSPSLTAILGLTRTICVPGARGRNCVDRSSSGGEPAVTSKPALRKRAKLASPVELPADTERDPVSDDLLPGGPTDS